MTAADPEPSRDTWPERYPSPVPRRHYSSDATTQLAELEDDVQLARFARSRAVLAGDRYRPAYHFTSPEGMLNDPNGLCFWRGAWHLFYQGYPPDEFPDAADILKRRQHWGHAISDDLIHWRDLPYALYPGIERACFSGSTLVEEDRVVAFYQGLDVGQMVAVANDPLLLNWSKLEGNPVIRGQPNADPCIWREGDTYCVLLGGREPYGSTDAAWTSARLWTSTDLIDWAAHGDFLERSPFTGPADDGACPNFLPIGDRHILLHFSHTSGGQYLLGDYDRPKRSFRPYHHGRFNHAAVAPGGVHAPSAASDGAGGVFNILNINDGLQSDDWDQMMSLAQHLRLGPDAQLRLSPVEAAKSLRGSGTRIGELRLPANEEVVVSGVEGDTLELGVEIDPQLARWVRLDVLRSPDGDERTSITFFNYDRVLSYWYPVKGVLCLDGSRSSAAPDVWVRPPERAVLERGGEPLRLRVFIDRSVVEVFANDRQYHAMRVDPERYDSRGIAITAHGQPARLLRLDAWPMSPILPSRGVPVR